MPETKKLTDRGLYNNYLKIKGALEKSFINRTPLVSVGNKGFTITGIAALGIQSKTNMYFIGSRGSGKTLLAEAIKKSVFDDKGFYLRGDINLQLKDLLVKLNLHGKTEEEIYRISENIKFNFALIDELNRVPGVLQNQFLNILDGYIEIRGVKYPLGDQKYMLMAATGNPPVNGDYTGVFDEDLALLDRIPLIINTDEIPLEKGDVYTIGERDINKDSIPQHDLTVGAIESYVYLKEKMRGDPEINAAYSLLKEFVYNVFRYIKVNNATIDKAQEKNWRDALHGEHSGGLIVSYCSDISVRTLQNAGKLAFAMFNIAETENRMLRESGLDNPSLNLGDFVNAYMEALKLALNYDRRFISEDLLEQIGKKHSDMLSDAFNDVRFMIDNDQFGTALVLLTEFTNRLNAWKTETRITGIYSPIADEEISAILNFTNRGAENSPIMEAAHRVMEARIREAGKESIIGMAQFKALTGED